MELIPGLPNDLARECLFRLPFQSFPFLLPVCKAWNREIRSPDFHQRRRDSGHARPVFVLTQRDRLTPSRWILVFDPNSGIWTRLPPMPDLPPAHPDFRGVVDLGSSKILVITNGWDRPWGTVRALHMVHVFDFLTGQWRRAADMPGPPGRTNFGLASDPGRGKALVAGGQGAKERRETMMYDVADDEWVRLGDMATGRESCSVVFRGGRFHVMGGSQPPSFGLGHTYVSHVESLDPETSEWGPVKEEACEFYGVMANGEGGDLYSIHTNVVHVQRGGGRGGGYEWNAVAELPEEVRCRYGAVMWRDEMVVNGARVYVPEDEPFYTYLLDLKNGEWSKVDMPHGYSSTMLQKGCGMDL